MKQHHNAGDQGVAAGRGHGMGGRRGPHGEVKPPHERTGKGSAAQHPGGAGEDQDQADAEDEQAFHAADGLR